MRDQARNNPRLIGGVYQVGQVITSGPMLTMYSAYNRNTGDVVGLQVLELPPPVNVQSIERLLRPLERRRSVRSLHVLRVHDWGIDSAARAYITTDPPRGLTLRHVLDNEGLEMQRALEMVRQLVRGVSLLHAGGIVGLDLRSQLITVDTGEMTERVQIDDVGMRALLRELGYVDSQQTDDIGFLDPRYAAPESLQGGTIGPASDVYQVGLLLFELVTGRLPFVGKNFAETGVLQRTGSVPRLEQFKSDVPLSLQRVVDRALAKQPAQRYMHASALLTALEAVQFPSAVAKEHVYAYLCAETNGLEAQRFAVTGKDVVVGRADPKQGYTPDIDLTALDLGMTMSRQHARLRYREPVFSIEDLRSRNKTKLGELELTPKKAEQVRHGDVLQFGAVRLVFKLPGM